MNAWSKEVMALYCFTKNYFRSFFHSCMIENISFVSSSLLKYWLVCFVFTFPYILFHIWKKKFLKQTKKSNMQNL